MRSHTHRTAAAVGALAAVAALTVVPPPAAAAGTRDVTADVLAGRDVTLDGDTVVTVPSGTTRYDGVFRGEGTLTVRGSGTLMLTRNSDFTLPRSRQRQTVRTLGGDHPYVTVTDPDPPAITVERGATLQYGDGGTTGLIGHFPYDTPAFRLNQDNIRVDGTLRLSLRSAYNLGTVSGSGLITQPRFLWGTWDLSGTHSFSGVIDNGTQLNAGRPEYATSLPNVRKILNQGTFTVDTPPARTVTMGMDFYQREYGSDINVQSRPGGKVVLTGRYSWSDQGGDTDPSLSDPALNWTPAHKNVNKRGTDIKGADVRWGDGTTDEIFMPGTAETVYINLLAARSRSRLTFDYSGPVTLGAPIGGGRFHDTLSAPGAGDIVIAGTKGNDVTFAAAQYYDGSTTVEKGAVLRLGSGAADGDGSLLTGTQRRRIVNDGTLVVRNTRTAISLSRLGGSGSFVQSGAATTTLEGASVTYTGTTTVRRGTLALRDGATLVNSRAVTLTSAGARLDTGGSALRVTSTLSGKGTVKGSVTNEGVVAGGLTVTGDYTQDDQGRLVVGNAPLKVGGKVRLAGHLDLSTAEADPAQEITVLDHSGHAPVTGAFEGLEEGGEVKLADTVHRISYRGGDGNDVVLTATSASPSTAGRGQGAPGAVTTDPRSATAVGGGLGWWPYVLAAGLLAGLMLPVSWRTWGGRRRRGGRHAA
ncbi:autotransporter [Streptomyces sp. NPDC052016]|uniref:autotransporter n=1 Tax=Streptomyces sp. NPDC052016 TaxID=3365680 RepID=UPI0037D3A0EF